MELSLIDAKAKEIKAREEDINFLEFTIGVKRSIRTGRRFSLIRPSKKAMKHIKAKTKSLTDRTTLALSTKVVIEKLNEVERGWVVYFSYGSCSRDMLKLKKYLEERVQIYLRHKHRRKGRGLMTLSL